MLFDLAAINHAACQKMKTYKTTVYPSQHKLYELFCETLESRFDNKIKNGLKLGITETTEGIEIDVPGYYETFLYKIKIIGPEIHVSKSEHYIDDVNSLALEDLIDNIIVEYLGSGHIETVLQP